MQELLATAMGYIPVRAIPPTPAITHRSRTPATTHRSRTPGTPHLTAAPTATTHPTATTGSPIPASMEGGVIISGGVAVRSLVTSATWLNGAGEQAPARRASPGGAGRLICALG